MDNNYSRSLAGDIAAGLFSQAFLCALSAVAFTAAAALLKW